MKKVSKTKQYLLDAAPGAIIGAIVSYYIVRKHNHTIVNLVSVGFGIFVGAWVQHFLLDKENDSISSGTVQQNSAPIETTIKR